jgi:hypothetical protein
MRDFASGPEVTATCLSCHTEAGDQVMHSLHFTWDFNNPATRQVLGKRNVLNSFRGNVSTNETRCTSCHIGYGWEDTRVSAPADPTAVDCLACHDRSGQYAKQDNLAGHPLLDPVAPGAKTITGADAWAVDPTEAAQSASGQRHALKQGPKACGGTEQRMPEKVLSNSAEAGPRPTFRSSH